MLLTGASSGIGRGLSIEMAKRGATVGLVARRADLLEEIVGEIQASGGRAIPMIADVKDAASIREQADRLRHDVGPIDMLIANAGIGGAAHATKLQPEVVAEVIRVNLIGAANSVAAVLPEMAQRNQGHLVAMSSLSAYRGLAKSAAYCSSKAGLSTFFESLRVDLRGTNVKVSIIHPGFIKTALTAGRNAKMPYLMELEYGVNKILWAIEKEKKTYSFPWQLASVVRLGLLMPNWMYDWIAQKNSLRE